MRLPNLTQRSPGRAFERLWAAYAVSTYGTWLGFGAFAIVAIRVLHEGAAQVALLSAVGLAVGALLVIPVGPWMEFRSKRPLMIAMDLLRFGALTSLPVAYFLGVLTFAQLLVVSIIGAAGRIVFQAASGTYLKSLVATDDLLVANARFESTTWSASIVGPTLGGVFVAIFGPLTTICMDAASYLLSAGTLRSIRGTDEAPDVQTPPRSLSGLVDGWRFILRDGALRPLFFNTVLVNALIMAGEPVLTVLMLGRLGFSTWEYGLAFSVPCIGGLVGSRLAGRVVRRFGPPSTLVGLGVLRVCWPIGLVLVRPGVFGLLVVIVIELGLILCCAMFNPVLATWRLEHTDTGRLTRVLSSWSISSGVVTAGLTALWGVLAAATTPRTALGTAGVLLLLTPLLLLRVRSAGSIRPTGRTDSADPSSGSSRSRSSVVH